MNMFALLFELGTLWERKEVRELRETGQNDRKGIPVDCLRAFVSSAERKGLH